MKKFIDGYIDNLIGEDARVRQIKRRIEELETMITDHDCHLIPGDEDGCDCCLWKSELNDLLRKPDSTIL